MCFIVMFLGLAIAPSALAQQKAAPTVVQPGAPGTPSQVLPPSTNARAAVVAAPDVEFMQGMIMHHQQAVEMSELIPSHTTDKALLDLGHRISLSQQDEIRFMRHWLEVRGQPAELPMHNMHGTDDMNEMRDMKDMHEMHHDGTAMSMPPSAPKSMPMMPGMLTPEQMEALRNARGKEFDRLFLEGMIQHHGGALTMVRELFDSAGSGQDAEVFDFATDVDNGQRAEIRLMERMLKEAR